MVGALTIDIPVPEGKWSQGDQAMARLEFIAAQGFTRYSLRRGKLGPIDRSVRMDRTSPATTCNLENDSSPPLSFPGMALPSTSLSRGGKKGGQSSKWRYGRRIGAEGGEERRGTCLYVFGLREVTTRCNPTNKTEKPITHFRPSTGGSESNRIVYMRQGSEM